MATHHPRDTLGGRKRSRRQRAAPSNLISGPGWFFTCPRAKEAPSVHELKDLLERVTDELGITLVDTDPQQTSSSLPDDAPQADSDADDIASQIHKELEALKGSAGHSGKGGCQKKNPALKFESKMMDCECLGFLRFPAACDPVRFAKHIVESIRTGTPGYGLRFIQRVTPVSVTCAATNLQEFEKMSFRALEPHFGLKYGSGKVKDPDSLLPVRRTGLKFRIESIVRCHDTPLNRTEVIRIVGDVVNRFNEDVYIAAPDEDSSGHDPSDLRHRVSINDAEIVILVSVYRYVAGISVVRGYDKEGKRFNLQALAQAREHEFSAPTLPSPPC